MSRADLTVAVAQFAPRDGDPQYNLSVMEQLVAQAKKQGAQVISFHEMCISAYTFCKDLSRAELEAIAEPVPEGQSVQQLICMAQQYDMAILAGLLEKENGKLFNTYVAVGPTGLYAQYRKIHPFISPHLSAGTEYVVFDLYGWSCGILICYDNNVVENVRATALLGADIIFAPHVTMCTPSSVPGRGFVDDALWQNRHDNPEALRAEFDGPKGREWLMRWLPARAYDNGVYYVFTNPIGYDGSHLKNGNSLVLDPYGDIITEIRSFEDAISVAILTEEKIQRAGGRRYRNARKPELYRDILGADHRSETKAAWLTKHEAS